MKGKGSETNLCYKKQETHLENKNVFDDFISCKKNIFKNRETLSSSHIPNDLPHRDNEINILASALVPALKNETASNLLVYGKPGTGKTATIKFVGKALRKKADKNNLDVEFLYINCQFVDTQYRILQKIAKHYCKKNKESIPFSGWPTDEIYSKFLSLFDKPGSRLIIVLDEADKLKGDASLYTLTRLNNDLKFGRVSVICVSNNLRFTEFLDPRVQSSLGEEQIIFKPYNAGQIQDILKLRAQNAFNQGVLQEEVIPLCAALAAQEHGDARRALDLLRISAELADRKFSQKVTRHHVKLAQNKIEVNNLNEAVKSLPEQTKLVLYSILKKVDFSDGKNKSRYISTGEIYCFYRSLCKNSCYTCLTQRRVADFISELDMLGIINVRVVSKGKYGKTRKISISSPDLLYRYLMDDNGDSVSDFCDNKVDDKQTRLI